MSKYVKQRLRELTAWAGHANIQETDNTILETLKLVSEYIEDLESQIKSLNEEIEEMEWDMKDYHELTKDRL